MVDIFTIGLQIVEDGNDVESQDEKTLNGENEKKISATVAAGEKCQPSSQAEEVDIHADESENIVQTVESVLNDVVSNVSESQRKVIQAQQSLSQNDHGVDPVADELFVKEKPRFSFDRKVLAPSRRVPLYCKVCAEEGHRTSECVSMGNGSVTPLKQLPEYFLQMLTRVCLKIFQDNKLTEQEKQSRSKVLNEVERHLQKFLDRMFQFLGSISMFEPFLIVCSLRNQF